MPVKPSLLPSLLAASAVLLTAGKAQVDPETARRRATFANGDLLAPARWPELADARGWDCSYHATTTELVFPGQVDVTYHATFAVSGQTLVETATGVHGDGGAELAPFTAAYVWTQAGLKAVGQPTRLLRGEGRDALGVEWLYAAAPGDLRGDPGIGDPHLRALAFVTCAPAAATGGAW